MVPDHFYVHHTGPGVFAWFFMLLLALLLIGLVVAFVARRPGLRPLAAGPVPRPSHGEDALALVRMRYARGEIDRETFLQASEDLGGLPPPS